MHSCLKHSCMYTGHYRKISHCILTHFSSNSESIQTGCESMLLLLSLAMSAMACRAAYFRQGCFTLSETDAACPIMAAIRMWMNAMCRGKTNVLAQIELLVLSIAQDLKPMASVHWIASVMVCHWDRDHVYSHRRYTSPIKSLRTSLPGELRRAPHAPSPRFYYCYYCCYYYYRRKHMLSWLD